MTSTEYICMEQGIIPRIQPHDCLTKGICLISFSLTVLAMYALLNNRI
jgi:hypothetical protein